MNWIGWVPGFWRFFSKNCQEIRIPLISLFICNNVKKALSYSALMAHSLASVEKCSVKKFENFKIRRQTMSITLIVPPNGGFFTGATGPTSLSPLSSSHFPSVPLLSLHRHNRLGRGGISHQ
jgi:hypothetical protein